MRRNTAGCMTEALEGWIGACWSGECLAGVNLDQSLHKFSTRRKRTLKWGGAVLISFIMEVG